MKFLEKISLDLQNAMKQRDKKRLPVLRALKSALKNEEIEKKRALSEKEALAILVSQVKSRKQAIELYERGNRPELAQIEKSEIEIIESYLPKALSKEELEQEVKNAISQLQASSMKDMGTVMKFLKEKLDSRADGKILSNLVRAALK